MYEKHFGLTSRPFGANATGAGVFVGPRQSRIMASLGKGLQASDAVVTITGPVGVGKTTIVNRALESISPDRMVVRIGRMQLAADEVLILLLAGCGVSHPPTSKIQQFAEFRRQLHENAAAGVTIVVEDAHRIGSETLAEIETLSAADAGDHASASVIIMGQPALHDLLGTPDLARLNQRNRLRQSIAALSRAETLGYLKYSMRNAGGDFDSVFDDGVADIVFACSEGLPRIINTLCETALCAAAEDDVRRISTVLIQQVASDAFGYTGTSVSTEIREPVEDDAKTESVDDLSQPKHDSEDVDWEALPVAEFSAEAEIEHNVVVESGCYPVVPEAAQVDSDDAPKVLAADEIPHLIEDTQSAVAVIDPPLTRSDTAESNSKSDNDFDLDAALSPETDENNIMPAETHNLDAEAGQDRQAGNQSSTQDAESAPPATTNPAEQELPVLASSTRVDDNNLVGDRQPATVTSITDRVIAPGHEAEPAPELSLVVESSPALDSESSIDPESEPGPHVVQEPGLAPEPEVARQPGPDPVPEPTSGSEQEVIVATEPDPDSPTDIAPILPASSVNSQNQDDDLEAALEAVEQDPVAAEDAGDSDRGSNESSPIVSAEVAAPAEKEVDFSALIAKGPKNDAELEDIVRQTCSANSLENMSDIVAETIFGCDALNEIAANVIANPPPADTQSDVAEHATDVMLSSDELAANVNGHPPEEADTKHDLPAPEIAAMDSNSDHLRQSVAMRMDLVASLKRDSHVETPPPAEAINAAPVEVIDVAPVEDPPKQTGPQLEPIERQINTSMSQTLEALNVSGEADVQDEKKKSGGFFGLFKKSS